MRFGWRATLRCDPMRLLSARLGGDAANNVASVARHNGRTALWAEQGPFGLALLAVDEHGRGRLARASVGCEEASATAGRTSIATGA